MADSDDLMALGMDALQEAKEISIAIVRDGKASVVNRPAFARDLPRAERIARHREFLSAPATMAMRYDELQAQYKLPDDRPIPRRLLDYGKLIARELAEEERKERPDA